MQRSWSSRRLPTPEELAGLPNLKSTEAVPLEQKLVHVHFFLGGSDWYGVEYDPARRLFFGYAVLNDDLGNAKWGHFSFDELRDVKVRGLEIDYDIDWHVRPAREVERIRQGMRWTQSAAGSIGHERRAARDDRSALD